MLVGLKRAIVKPFEHGSVPKLVSSDYHFKEYKDEVEGTS
jgi:hypothetical protein